MGRLGRHGKGHADDLEPHHDRGNGAVQLK